MVRPLIDRAESLGFDVWAGFNGLSHRTDRALELTHASDQLYHSRMGTKRRTARRHTQGTLSLYQIGL